MVDAAVDHASRPRRLLRLAGRALLWTVLALLTLWAVAALYIDVRIAALRAPLAAAYATALVAACIVAHTMVSFGFGDGQYLCLSSLTRTAY